MQRRRDVESRLPTHGGEQGVGTFLFDYHRNPFGRDGLDVCLISQLRIRHYRRRVGIHQNHPVALFLQRLDRLRAGIIEFRRLTDDDGT